MPLVGAEFRELLVREHLQIPGAAVGFPLDDFCRLHAAPHRSAALVGLAARVAAVEVDVWRPRVLAILHGQAATGGAVAKRGVMVPVFLGHLGGRTDFAWVVHVVTIPLSILVDIVDVMAESSRDRRPFQDAECLLVESSYRQ